MAINMVIRSEGYKRFAPVLLAGLFARLARESSMTSQSGIGYYLVLALLVREAKWLLQVVVSFASDVEN